MSHSSSRRPGGRRRARSFLIVCIAVLTVVPALAATAAGAQTTDDTISEKLIRSGPMTPQKAELLGKTVEFGENCDTTTGRVKLPSLYAAPCVEPFTGKNGGATSPGVTADSIKIIAYVADPSKDPLLAATIKDAGADVGAQGVKDTMQGYVDGYNKIYELYGRKVDLEFFDATGAAADTTAAKADAIAIASKKPFAVIGGPQQSTTVFSDELAARGVVCVGTCATAVPNTIQQDHAPYIWSDGPNPEEGALLAGEMISKIAPPGKAKFAGDPDLKNKKRVYGVAHYDTPDGQYAGLYKQLASTLKKNGINVKSEASFFLDVNKLQESARTIITKFKNAGVTTVIYTGDPLSPATITKEATAQDYSPEWILGPSVLADTAIFGRTFDQDQWKNAFGVSLIPGRGADETQEALKLYRWFTGEEPPSNTRGVINPSIHLLFRGIHLAGPKLTPKTFRDGEFRYPITGDGAVAIQQSFGDHGIWPFTDYSGSDTAAIIWWDPEAKGQDEVGADGDGLYRYANEGQRYSVGEFPSETESGLHDDASSVTIFDTLPPADTPPDYPSPATG